MTKPYTKTYNSGSASGWWLTIKRGKPMRCTNKPCRRAINIGDRFLYRHGIPGVLERCCFCLSCSAGIAYKISDRVIEVSDRPVNQQRILNALAIRGEATKPNLSKLLNVGLETTGRHLKLLERHGLVKRLGLPQQVRRWSLTPEGEAVADSSNAGFPPLPGQQVK